jgi:hypothetical protein
VVVSVWVLDVAQVVVLAVDVAGVATVANGDVTAEQWWLECENQGPGLGNRTVGRLGSVLRRF